MRSAWSAAKAATAALAGSRKASGQAGQPQTAGIGRVQVRLQRLEQRVLLQGDATALPEERQRGDFRIVRRALEEAPVEQLQHLVLGGRDACVVDQRRRRAGRPAGPGRPASARAAAPPAQARKSGTASTSM